MRFLAAAVVAAGLLVVPLASAAVFGRAAHIPIAGQPLSVIDRGRHPGRNARHRDGQQRFARQQHPPGKSRRRASSRTLDFAPGSGAAGARLRRLRRRRRRRPRACDRERGHDLPRPRRRRRPRRDLRDRLTGLPDCSRPRQRRHPGPRRGGAPTRPAISVLHGLGDGNLRRAGRSRPSEAPSRRSLIGRPER